MKSRAAVDQTLLALSDPTRRAVVDLLCVKPRRAGELADELAISAPALSKHLRILRAGGVVSNDAVSGDARIRLYRLNRDALVPVRDWIGEVEAFWGNQPASFKAFAETPKARRRK